jgi:hypothetical protein
VNTPSMVLAATHIDALLAEAAAERLARSVPAQSKGPNRFVAAMKSVWSTLAGPSDQPGSLPSLADYPYRG